MTRTAPSLLAFLTLSLVASPAEAHSNRSHPRDIGTIEVMNRTPVPITVSVESGGTRVLRPWETAHFSVAAGRRTVRATYSQFSAIHTLFSTEVRVRDHRVVRLDATPPKVGRVQVVNDTRVLARVFDNGHEVADLAPGASRILTVPLGRNDVHIVAEGLTLESEHLIVNAFGNDTVVGHAPRSADLAVSNPLPFAVELTLGCGTSRRVAAYGSTVLDDVRTGRTEVTVRRLGGQFVDQSTVDVDPFHGGRMRVEVPNTGLVQLESADDDMLRVTVEGRLVATMAPFQETTLLLPRGPAYLEVRELDGTLVARSVVNVDPLRSTDMQFGRVERYDRGQHERDDRHEHEMARR